MIATHSLAKLELEIAECEVRCCNCHRLWTAERAGGTARDPAPWIA